MLSIFLFRPWHQVRGLELLAELAHVAGRTGDAEKCTSAAAGLRTGIVKHMWDATSERFCDGICTEVAGNHSIYSDMYVCFITRGCWRFVWLSG